MWPSWWLSSEVSPGTLLKAPVPLIGASTTEFLLTALVTSAASRHAVLSFPVRWWWQRRRWRWWWWWRGGGSGDGGSGGSRGDGGESNCSCELLNHASCSSCTHTFTLRPPRLPLHHPNLSAPLGSSEDPDIHREAFGACEET